MHKSILLYVLSVHTIAVSLDNLVVEVFSSLRDSQIMGNFLTKFKKTIAIWLSNDEESKALHQCDDDGKHTIAIDSLRVIVIRDSDSTYFAQSIDIDYAASGCSLEEVKQNFAKGLAMTLSIHLKRFGNIDKVMRNPKNTDLKALFDKQSAMQAFKLNHVSTCKFENETLLDCMPYHSISFVEGPRLAS